MTRAERQVASAESGYRETQLAGLMHGKVDAEDLAIHEHLATKVTKIDYALRHPARVASLYFGPAHLWQDVPASVQWQRANASVKLAKSIYSVSHTLPRWLDARPPRSAGDAPVPAH